MPKVSVIMPSYNHEDFIADAILSVLSQTFQDFELLICDDASTDNSVNIIKSFHDDRIKLIVNHRNMGAVYTVNYLIQLSSGQYIALLNSDDIWMLDKLDKQVAFLDSNTQYGAVFSHAEVINEDNTDFVDNSHFYFKVFEQPNRTRIEWLRYFFYNGNCLCHPSMLIRKSIYSDIGLYNGLLGSVPDFEMWVRVIRCYDIYILQEELVKFRILNNERNTSGSSISNILRSSYELGKIFDAFSFINDVDLFNAVFDGDLKANNVKDIPILLIQKSLKDYGTNIQLWAVDKLYDLLTDDYSYYSTYISDNEFIKITASFDLYNRFLINESITQLFYSTVGEPFNEDKVITHEFKLGLQTYKFSLNHTSINKLRFDPINQPAKISSLQISVSTIDDTDVITDFIHNGVVLDGIYNFEHVDPNFEFILPDFFTGKAITIEIIANVVPYSWEETLHIINKNIIKCTNLEIEKSNLEIEKSNLEIESYNLKTDLISKNELLENIKAELLLETDTNRYLENQLALINNSLSYKITKPLRLIKRLCGRFLK